MSTRPFRASALVVAAVLACTTAAQSQQTLKWKFRPGQRLNYIVQQDMTMSLDYNGRAIASTMKQTGVDTSLNPWLR